MTRAVRSGRSLRVALGDLASEPSSFHWLIIAAAAVGVWLTVPEAASDCPVIGGLDPAAIPSVSDPSPPR